MNGDEVDGFRGIGDIRGDVGAGARGDIGDRYGTSGKGDGVKGEERRVAGRN